MKERRLLEMGVAAVVLSVASFCGAGEPRPLNDSEVYAFLSDYGLAFKRCDVRSVKAYYLPTAKMVFEVKGKPVVTKTIDEYLDWYGKNCWHMTQVFDRNSTGLRVEGKRATVIHHSQKGNFSKYLYLKITNVQAVEDTYKLIRSGENIKIESVRQLIIPVPETEQGHTH